MIFEVIHLSDKIWPVKEVVDPDYFENANQKVHASLQSPDLDYFLDIVFLIEMRYPASDIFDVLGEIFNDYHRRSDLGKLCKLVEKLHELWKFDKHRYLEVLFPQ